MEASLLPISSHSPRASVKRTYTLRYVLGILGFAALVFYYLDFHVFYSSPTSFSHFEKTGGGKTENISMEAIPDEPATAEPAPAELTLVSPPAVGQPPFKPLLMFQPEDYDEVPPLIFDPLDKHVKVPFTLHSLPLPPGSIDWWSDPHYTFLKGFLSASNSMHPFRAPTCTMAPWHLERFAPVINSTSRIYLALNLKNNENVLPSLMQSLITLIPLLGPERFFVSIVESGSTKQDWTPTLILLLSHLLDTFGVKYRLKADGYTYAPKKDHGHRITALAEVRNDAMLPLYESLLGEFDHVLFMNDIVHCPSDVLELLYQHWSQTADMTCSLDWENERIYDRWVLRAMSGRPYYVESEINAWWKRKKAPPLPEMLANPTDREAKERIKSYLPTQVFSCWNGMALIDARAFYPPNSIRFREARNDQKHSNKVSECLLLPVDLWKAGMRKILVAPRASVAYNMNWYERFRSDIAAPSIEASQDREADRAREQVKWDLVPPKKIVYLDGTAAARWRWAPWDES